MFTCDQARVVWQSLGVWERLQDYLILDRSGSVVIDEIIRREEMVASLDVGFLELVLMTGWYIWWERRQLVHGESIQAPAKSAMSIAALTKNYQNAMKKTS
jgi:hypothetical protein